MFPELASEAFTAPHTVFENLIVDNFEGDKGNWLVKTPYFSLLGQCY